MARFTLVALSTVTFLFSGFASAAFDCSVSGGPGTTQVAILQQSEFVVLYPKSVKTVFSCGPFVNDGSVVVDENTALVELASNTCEHFPVPGYTQIVFCI